MYNEIHKIKRGKDKLRAVTEKIISTHKTKRWRRKERNIWLREITLKDDYIQ